MRFLWLIAISIVLIFAFGCAQKQSPVVQEPGAAPVQPAANLTETAPCSTGNVVQKDQCFFDRAKGKSDPEICRGIYDIGKLDACYAQFASTRLEICKRISDGSMRAVCLTENAASQKSEEICNLIDNAENRAACLRQVVPECMLLMDAGKRELCIALEKKDYTFCTSDACRLAYAKNTTDANACGLISVEADKYACVAEVNSDVSKCSDAALAGVRDLCVEKSAIALGTINGCDFATEGSDYRNRCYLHFALVSLNSSICRRAAPEEGRDQCYSDYATKAADTSSCPKIINSLNRDACYYYAAGANRMPSLCNPLTIEAQRNDCYSRGVSPDAGPLPTDCALVYSQDWKNKCYYKAARVTYNGSLCEPITPGPDKTSCNSLFGLQ